MLLPYGSIKTLGGKTGQISFGSLIYSGAKEPITAAQFLAVFTDQLKREGEEINAMLNRQQEYMNNNPGNNLLKTLTYTVDINLH
jgi:hypothetical protein